MLAPGTLFELGFNYIGPMNGHNLDGKDLENLKDLKGPKLLHLITQKEKFSPAEKNPIGPNILNKIETKKNISNGKKYSAVFGDWLSKKLRQ